MDLFTIALIGVGLAMDAFAVTLAKSIAISDEKIIKQLKMPIAFAFFQALMPFLGYYGGTYFEKYFVNYSHYISFFLLAFIGAKMIKESFSCDIDSKSKLDFVTLIILAIATSIDALAVGVSFAFLKVNIYLAIAIIAIETFIICFIALLLGKKAGCYLKQRAELIGGIILILIGFKILIEHFIG